MIDNGTVGGLCLLYSAADKNDKRCATWFDGARNYRADEVTFEPLYKMVKAK